MPVMDDFKAWVRLLADPLRSKGAFWHLVLSGRAARPAATEGLADPNPDVRRQCARVLDHLADESSFADLAGMLSDPDHQVRAAALHAVACDRCKEGTCRPDKDMVLRPALQLLENDPHKHVRAMAAEVVGRYVHSDLDAEAGLVRAREADPDPSVRKKAGWYAPGGTIFNKTRPRSARQAS